MGADTCVCCGEYVPEGRLVCQTCEEAAQEKASRDAGTRKRGACVSLFLNLVRAAIKGGHGKARCE